MPTVDALTLDFDARVEAFESRMAEGTATVADIADYLPDADDPARTELLVELLRVALELEWNRGQRPLIDQYLTLYPEAAASPSTLEPLAFEEYRLRTQAGERLEPTDYEVRFGFASLSWPKLTPGEQAWESFARSSPDAAVRLQQACRSLPEIGDDFAEFELLSELGRGAFARVFLARQRSLAGRLVALKITAGPTGEPQHLARLQHGNIVPVFSAHAEGPLTGLCMPYLGNTTLADVARGVWRPLRTRRAVAPSSASETAASRISVSQAVMQRRDSPKSGRSIVSTLNARRSLISTLPGSHAAVVEATATQPTSRLLDQLESSSYVEAVVRLVARVADGLAHAHDRGVVHHDLKPANILLADDGEPLILDFNLASRTGPESAGMAMVGGTLPYMAPEQLRLLLATPGKSSSTLPDPKVVDDPRSDLFSLGIVLYELLVGCTPHELRGGTLETVTSDLLKAWSGNCPAPRSVNAAVPRALDAITRKCLAVDIEARYQSARELADDLRCQLAHLPLTHAPEPWGGERLQKWMLRHPRIASGTTVGLVAALLLVSLGAAWFARGRQLERHSAELRMRSFEAGLSEARVMLIPGVREVAPVIADQGVSRGQQLLALYGIDDRKAAAVANGEKGVDSPLLVALDDTQRDRVQSELRSLARLVLAASLNRAENAALSPTVPSSAAMAGAEVATLQARSNTVPSEPLLLALEHMQAGDDALAANQLERSLQAMPQDAAAWLALGYCRVRLGQLSQAEIAYSMCAALAPSLPQSLYFRGLARLESKRYEDARDDFNATLEKTPGFAEAHFHRAVAAQGLGKHEDAIADFDKALELGLPHTRTYFLRARSRAALGQVELAKADRALGAKTIPTDAASWVARALDRMSVAPALSADDFREALKLQPSNTLALGNLAHVLSERLGKIDESIEVLDRWIECQPRDPLPRGSRGVLRARQGDWNAAIADAEEALKLSQSPFTRYQAASVYAVVARRQPERKKQAIELLALALKVQPTLAVEMRVDQDLSALREEEAFQRLMKAGATLVEAGSLPEGKR